MNRTTKILLTVLAVTCGLWLVYAKVFKTLYLDPRAAAIKSIAAAEATLADYRKNRQDESRVRKELDRFANRTLGADFETVDHMLRTRLKRIAEGAAIQIQDVNTTGAAVRRTSPAKSKFSRYRDLRDEPDFYELEGWVSGTGTFNQVLKLIESIEAEPWMKRIDQLKLDPRDNGARFNVTVRLTTLYLPNRKPNPDAAPGARSVSLDQYLSLVNTNPFRVPPAPPVKKNQPAVASGPPPFPFEQWSLTGVAENGEGAEVWLLNSQTHESRRLIIGEKLDQLVLVAAHGETAEFQHGAMRFAVAIGSAMSDRVQLSQ